MSASMLGLQNLPLTMRNKPAPRLNYTNKICPLPRHDVATKLASTLEVQSKPQVTILPKGSKLLDVIAPLLPDDCCRGGVIASGMKLEPHEKELFMKTFPTQREPTSGDSFALTQVWGVPWTDKQFVEQMVHFGHPCTMDTHLPEVLRNTVDQYFKMSESQHIEHRTRRLNFWIARLKALRQDQTKLKSQLEPDVRKVLRGKNLLIWKHMLQACDYPDMLVFDEFVSGTDLVGDVPQTGLWPQRFQPASITKEELADVARRERQRLVGPCAGGFPPDELEGEGWQQTLDEVKDGF